MSTRYTRYAEDKFEILNGYGVYIRKEEIEACLAAPDKVSKKGNYQSARKDGLKVVYKKNGTIKTVVTFFPVK